MKILIAPTAYKGTLSPEEVATAMQRGALRSRPDAELVVAPIADGGDGSLGIMHLSLGGEMMTAEAVDAAGVTKTVAWLLIDGLAIIELSAICGLAGLGNKRMPLAASTFGLGQVIRKCLDKQPKKILLLVGGSASTDGGAGALKALGARFTDAKGSLLALGGGSLATLASIDLRGLDKRLEGVSIEVAVDVANPLLGENGAANVFAPQKGASEAEIKTLECGLTQYANLLEEAAGKQLRDAPGSGAAGGTAFGLACALGAQIVPGAEHIANLISLSDKVAWADLVITGEGKLDRQSWMGKAVGHLAGLCVQFDRPLWAVCGDLAEAANTPLGLTRVAKAAAVSATVYDIEGAVESLLKDTDSDLG